MGRIGIKVWKWKAQESDEWRKTVEEAKAHKELKSQQISRSQGQ